jgi:hypothetical protein
MNAVGLKVMKLAGDLSLAELIIPKPEWRLRKLSFPGQVTVEQLSHRLVFPALVDERTALPLVPAIAEHEQAVVLFAR